MKKNEGGIKLKKEEELHQRGITLVALVVTIVVLLILAGITITYVMGDNSVFKKASDAKLNTELAKIEERASLIYSDKMLQKASENGNLKEKPTMQEIVGELREEGYTIEQVEVSGNAITGISLNKESMTLGFGMTNTIQVTLEGSNGEAYTYYVLVDGKYYKINHNNGLITIDRTESEISDTGDSTAQTLTVVSEDETVATATVDNTTNVVTVTGTNKAGIIAITVTYGSYTKTCNVTVKDIPVATKMELNSVRARIAAGYTRWLSAMTTPTDALQEFEWTSSDNSIATVDNNGVVTAKKEGTVTITAKTIDGSNKEGTCQVTVVENAPEVASLKDYQTKNTVAKDINGNLITVPYDFKVLTNLGTKVTDGIVIQDRDENEFVWVPIDSVSTGTSQPADDIRLGRYNDFTTKNASGNYVPKQDADNYTEIVTIGYHSQEKISNDGNTAAKNLEDFVTKTKVSGGYYIARYEASNNGSNKPLSQANKVVWRNVTQPDAATYAQSMYNDNSHVESDLINSYSWDTAIIFIQKYANSSYASQTSKISSFANTGISNDEELHIHDMASNYFEWSTEHYDYSGPCSYRGGFSYSNGHDASFRGGGYQPDYYYVDFGFRPALYVK